VKWLGCVYLAREKLPLSSPGQFKQPLDPVARFHLRNGAVMYQLNWMANPSTKGLNTSAGMMVNYLYDLNGLEENASSFQRYGTVTMSQHIQHILDYESRR
jgi:malonyl-CoA decarboxylase